jgi:hypothetical protein
MMASSLADSSTPVLADFDLALPWYVELELLIRLIAVHA